MNFFKNLAIIAVLGVVGYGVYASLARNNVDTSPPPGVAPAWPGVPKVELPATKPASNPPLALGATPVRPVPATKLGAGGAAPPFASPPMSGTAGSPSAGAAPLLPYPSTSASPVASGASPDGASAAAAPAITLGAPVVPVTPSRTTANPPAPLQASLPESMHSLAAPLGAARGLAPATNPTERLLQSKFAAFMAEVQKNLQQNKLAEAYQALSTLYTSAELPADQERQVTALLDQLAGTVVYSRRHFLEPPYITRQGDTLETVAQKYNVPWQLLGHVNGLMPPGEGFADTATKDLPLPVGMELKVVRGPFEAVVHLDRHELTLMVQNRYAGRFAIGVGQDQPQLEGSYVVRQKVLNPAYYGSDGANANPGDSNNPLGGAGSASAIGSASTGPTIRPPLAATTTAAQSASATAICRTFTASSPSARE